VRDVIALGWPRRRRAVSPAALAFGVGLALLLAASLRQAYMALDPVSLWLDDLWVATLVKRASLAQVFRLHAPAPFGFVVLEKIVRVGFGDGHLQLQAAPLSARLVAIAGAAWAAFELRRSFALGLIAASGMALQSEIAVQAVRVKQYSLDAAVSVIVLALTLRCSRRPSLPRLAVLGAFVLLALPCSFPSVFSGPVLFSLCALDMTLRDRRHALQVLALLVAVDVLVCGWLAIIVQQKATPALRDYWSGNYPLGITPAALAGFFGDGPGRAFLTGAFDPWPVLALLVPVGLYQLLRRRWTRPLGLGLLVLHAAVLASSLLRLYPLGVPRLDSYVRPVHIVLALAALQPLAAKRWTAPVMLSLWAAKRWLAPAAAALCFCAALQRLAREPVAYVPAGEKPLAAVVQRWLVDPTVGLLLFPWANWAYAYYTDEPVRLVPVTDSTNGFFAIPKRPQSWVLRETFHGVFFSDYARDARAFDEQLASLLSAAPKRLVYYGSYGESRDYRAMLRQLSRHGYASVQVQSEAQAIAVLLERH
jgi:hypothetical protein